MNATETIRSDDILDIENIRADFPILHQKIHDQPLAFLDNAASSQRPRSVIEAIKHYYEHDHANVHRGVHQLSQRATDAHEGARSKVREHINAASDKEIVFTSGTTESINLLAGSLGQSIHAGDEILITQMEHHSNIVPWFMLCERTGAKLVVAPMNDNGELIVDEMVDLMNGRTRLVSCAHVSNALGTINPIELIVKEAHARDIPVLIDGAQAAPHTSVDVAALGCEYYAFSGHKMCGPTGIGVLYAREECLRELPPWQGGGEMILSVSFDEVVYNDLPYKFEAGTPNISGAVGLGAAIDYLQSVGMEKIEAYEASLLEYMTKKLEAEPDIRLIGSAKHRAGVQSFVMEGVHAHDLGTILDHHGVALRTGHHCAQPVMDFFGISGTARASLAFYNTRAEVDQLIEGLALVREMFA